MPLRGCFCTPRRAKHRFSATERWSRAGSPDPERPAPRHRCGWLAAASSPCGLRVDPRGAVTVDPTHAVRALKVARREALYEGPRRMRRSSGRRSAPQTAGRRSGVNEGGEFGRPRDGQSDLRAVEAAQLGHTSWLRLGGGPPLMAWTAPAGSANRPSGSHDGSGGVSRQRACVPDESRATLTTWSRPTVTWS
jgi:hypothetical protein